LPGIENTAAEKNAEFLVSFYPNFLNRQNKDLKTTFLDFFENHGAELYV